MDGTVTTTTGNMVKTTAGGKRMGRRGRVASAINERRHFHDLLADLCELLPRQSHEAWMGPEAGQLSRWAARGDPQSLLGSIGSTATRSDAIVDMSKVPHFTSVLNIFDKFEVTPLLKS